MNGIISHFQCEVHLKLFFSLFRINYETKNKLLDVGLVALIFWINTFISARRDSAQALLLNKYPRAQQ